VLTRSLNALMLFASVLGPPGHAAAQRPAYPPAPPGGQVDDYHGTPVADPYRWLEDVDAPDTRAWIEAENRVTGAWLEAIPEREAIRRRLMQLWNYERYGVPFRRGTRYFYFKNDGLQNQAVLYSRTGLDADPKVLLDPNTLAADGTVALTSLDVTPDGRLLAYGTSASGSDWQTLRVRDVATGRDLPDRLEWIKFAGPSWTHGAGFFYSRYPDPPADQPLRGVNRDHRLFYHRLGTPQTQDREVYARPDQPDWGVSAAVTDDGRYVILTVWLGTDRRNRLYYMGLTAPARPALDVPVVRLLDEFDAGYTFVGNDGPVFYVLTDRDAPKRRIVAIDVRHPDSATWRTVVPEGVEVIENAHLVSDALVVESLRDAHSDLRVFGLDGRARGSIPLPGLGAVAGVSGRPGEPELFYAYTSFLFATTIYRYDLAAGEGRAFAAPAVDFDASRYETTQVFGRSADGTRVPVFLTHRRGLERDGSHPVYLTGYGGFNVSVTPAFSPAIPVWLERGGIYAVANLRGGGEYGEDWHRAGMLERKQNVFDDFIAAAEYLVAQGYTTPARLAIGGGSNGGLLVGAAITQRPDLFGAALPAVGVFDMLRFHRFTIGWAWVTEYGSADSAAHFPVLRAYSPLHNLRPGAHYPATLITTADHDDRVVPAHSFKFAAALQAAQGGPAPVLIRIETKAGHGAGKPTGKIVEEQADRWAFLVRVLGMGEAVGAGSGR
jgi:prolyl oligopeptidase